MDKRAARDNRGRPLSTFVSSRLRNIPLDLSERVLYAVIVETHVPTPRLTVTVVSNGDCVAIVKTFYIGALSA